MDEAETSCALCAVNKRRCSAKTDPTSRCTGCRCRSRRGAHDSVKEAHPFPSPEVQQTLYLQGSSESLSNFAQGTDPHDCRVEISSVSEGRTYQKTQIKFETNGRFVTYDEMGKPTWDEGMVSAFDQGISHSLSVKLAAKGQYQAITKAVLAGGYAHLLWSTIDMTAHVITFRNGQIDNNESEDHSITALMKNFLSHRIGELVEEVMNAVRFQDDMDEFPDYCSDAYSAAVILVREVIFFRNHSPGLPDHFKRWLTSVKTELLQHIQQGCQRRRQWHYPILGSMKEARRQPERLTMAIHINKCMSKLPDFEIGEPPSPSVSFSSQTPNSADHLFDFPLLDFHFDLPTNLGLKATALGGQSYVEGGGPDSFSQLLDSQTMTWSTPSFEDFAPQGINSPPPIATIKTGSIMGQSQVPLDISGQVPYYSSLSADHDESNMASLDPRTLSTERQRLRASYVPSNYWV